MPAGSSLNVTSPGGRPRADRRTLTRERVVAEALMLMPLPQPTTSETNTVRRRDWLGGLLHEYQQVA